MREKQLEQKLVRAVKVADGICPKFVSPGTDGMPDRMILLQGGRIGFVEVKAPGKKPRPLQVKRDLYPYHLIFLPQMSLTTPLDYHLSGN